MSLSLFSVSGANAWEMCPPYVSWMGAVESLAGGTEGSFSEFATLLCYLKQTALGAVEEVCVHLVCVRAVCVFSVAIRHFLLN